MEAAGQPPLSAAAAAELRDLETALDGITRAVVGYLPTADLGMVERAFRFAEARHRGQRRTSGEPYMVHPLGVSRIITQLRLDVSSLCAALLHDCVEDTGATVEEIEEAFGKDVAFLVDGVTKLSRVEFSSRAEREAENFRKMLVAMARDIRVLLVKLADRLHNCRTLEPLSPERQERIAAETLAVYAPLANRLGIDWLKSELEDHSVRYLYPEEWKDLNRRLEQRRRQDERFIVEAAHALEKLLEDVGFQAQVSGRLKRLYSIREKMKKQNLEFDQVHDRIGFRVIVETVADCYAVLGVVHSKWTPVPGRIKDYIAIPKINGYRSLHTTVFGPKGVRMEVQIRTQEMHAIAQEGIAAHWQYKEGGGLDPGGKDAERFAWLRQIWELHQDVQDSTELFEAVKGDLFSDEVYVFTPKGQVLRFPQGATPVDFAYAIHTDVGHHCTGARVNGHIVPLRYQLRSGDTLEILTHAQQRPNKDWLDFVVTSRAKAKIRSYVRVEQRRRSREVGRELLEREFRKAGVSLAKAEKHGDLEKAAKELRQGTLDEMVAAVGFGRVDPRQVIRQIVGGETPETAEPRPELRESKLAQVLRRVTRRDSAAIKIDSVDDLLVRLARCCSPVPGDDVVGFVSRGRGLTVHRRGCPRTLDLDPDRRIDVTWDAKVRFDQPVTLRIVTAHRPGILAAVSQVFSDHGINITQVNSRVTGPEEALNAVTFAVSGADKLRALTRSLERLEGVLQVTRT
jgi:GTP pyrophosphokinase